MQTVSYESDFVQWAFQQADLIRQGKFNHLDIANLIEEIECMGRSEHRELSNRLAVLIGHLLKWRFQPERQSNSWRHTINEQRRQVQKVLKDSPSLKTKLDDEYLRAALRLPCAKPIWTFFRKRPFGHLQKSWTSNFSPNLKLIPLQAA